MAKNAQCVRFSDGEIRWRLKSEQFACKIAYYCVSGVRGASLYTGFRRQIFPGFWDLGYVSSSEKRMISMSFLSFKNKDLRKAKKEIMVFIILFCSIFVQFYWGRFGFLQWKQVKFERLLLMLQLTRKLLFGTCSLRLSVEKWQNESLADWLPLQFFLLCWIESIDI